MQQRHYQQGISLLEVLVALLLLAIVVLGFVGVQYKITQADFSQAQQNKAIILANNLLERMQSNHQALPDYLFNSNTPSSSIDCSQSFCTAQQLAEYDISQISQIAKQDALSIAVLQCPATAHKQLCIYVAWGETTASDGQGKPHCTQGVAYVNNAECIMLEAYVYE